MSPWSSLKTILVGELAASQGTLDGCHDKWTSLGRYIHGLQEILRWPVTFEAQCPRAAKYVDSPHYRLLEATDVSRETPGCC